jgi:hypothetical protein
MWRAIEKLATRLLNNGSVHPAVVSRLVPYRASTRAASPLELQP